MIDINKFFCLDCQVKIYIPGTIDVNKDGANLQQVYTKRALELFSNLFGGATSGRYTGAWMSKNGLVTEDVNIIYAFCTGEQFRAGLESIYNLGREICINMGQEAVSLEFNNKLGFIEPGQE